MQRLLEVWIRVIDRVLLFPPVAWFLRLIDAVWDDEHPEDTGDVGQE